MLLPDEYAAKADRLRAAAREAGRDPASITLSLRVPMAVRPARAKAPAGDRPLFQGTATDVAGDVQTYADLGVSHFVFDPTVPDLKDVLASMRRFAEDVRPKLRRKARA
jgi:alkanesulfonate monooxygenase SsuD/methylene tetrahydromethanopterin reductase-like flavin-dependent oxidoreductase (luciferase family)